MQNIFPLILAAFFVYLMFFRKGGMGCCGSHSGQDADKGDHRHPEGPATNRDADIIDLQKDQYTVLPPDGDQGKQVAERAVQKKAKCH